MEKLKMSECSYFTGMKVRIYPSSKQKQIIKKNSDLSRFIYNEYVALNKKKQELTKALDECSLPDEKINLQSLIDEIKSFNSNPTNLERSISWMGRDKEIDPQTKYLALKAYKDAWNMWRKVPNSKPPTFKKRTHCYSYSTANSTIIDDRHFKVNKLGRIRVAGMRKDFLKAQLAVGKTTITKDNTGLYYLSVQLGSKEPFHARYDKTGSIIGVDLNVSNFYTSSNGDVLENPSYHKKALRQLSKKHKAYSRKVESAKKEKRKHRDSKNLEKARIALAKQHKKVAEQRKNFINVATNNLVKNHDFIICEDLKVTYMLKNRLLSRSIADLGWGEFLTQLAYKASMNDKIFLKVDPKYTTQTCSNCGDIMSGDRKIKLGVEKWTCPSCEAEHIRDLNAAINIRNKGMLIIKNK